MMAKKRADGEGTIYKSKYKDKKGEEKERWVGQITYGFNPETGKPKRKSFYGQSQKEVKDKIKKALQEVQGGNFIEPSKLTFGEWLDRWINDYMKPSIRQNTWDSYKIMIETHIKPTFGMVPLAKLHAADLQRFYNEKLKNGRVNRKKAKKKPVDGLPTKEKDQEVTGLSTRTVRYIHTIIKASLQQAIKAGLIIVNVADATNPPTIKYKEMQPFTESEAEIFLDAVKKDRLAAAFILALGTGLRRGELLGLHWPEVDLNTGVVTVKRQLIRTNSGTIIDDNLKTKSSRRNIPLPKNVTKELKAHKARQAQEKLLLGEAYQDQGLVFAREDGRTLDLRGFNRKFDRLLKAAGLPKISFHNLRHTHATLLLIKKEHPKVVQERLGHSSINMTLDLYSHVVPGIQEQAAEKLDSLFDTEKGSHQKGESQSK